MKIVLLSLAAVSLLTFTGGAQAQTQPSSLLKPGSVSLAPTPRGSAGATPVPTPDPSRSPSDNAERKGPTEITATEQATFDEKTRIAVFVGAVHVNDPQFVLDCDKLTAYLKKPPEAGASPSPKGSAPSKASASASPAKEDSGLERAIGEGHVVIVQDKPGAPGEKPTKYIGRAERCEYESSTGDMRLIGSPQVQQGINTHVSLKPTTVMILNRNGTMRTEGPTKTTIQDQESLSSPEKSASPHP